MKELPAMARGLRLDRAAQYTTIGDVHISVPLVRT